MNDKNAYFDTMTTPLGDLNVVVDDDGRLLAIAFMNDDQKPGITQSWDRTVEGLERAGFAVGGDAARTSRVRGELTEYFAGRRHTFDLELAPNGTDFQQKIWRLLCAIPCGETRSYADLARAAGRPKAARAVGRAVATNPIPIVVPCHRVVGADGSLTGFAGGLRFKQGLLELEGDQMAI